MKYIKIFSIAFIFAISLMTDNNGKELTFTDSQLKNYLSDNVVVSVSNSDFDDVSIKVLNTSTKKTLEIYLNNSNCKYNYCYYDAKQK